MAAPEPIFHRAELFYKKSEPAAKLAKVCYFCNVPRRLDKSKYSYLSTEVAVYCPEEAAYILGGRETLDDCVAAGWLTPVYRGHKMTRYSSADVRRCGLRLQKGEWPPSAPARRIKLSGVI